MVQKAKHSCSADASWNKFRLMKMAKHRESRFFVLLVYVCHSVFIQGFSSAAAADAVYRILEGMEPERHAIDNGRDSCSQKRKKVFYHHKAAKEN